MPATITKSMRPEFPRFKTSKTVERVVMRFDFPPRSLSVIEYTRAVVTMPESTFGTPSLLCATAVNAPATEAANAAPKSDIHAGAPAWISKKETVAPMIALPSQVRSG